MDTKTLIHVGIEVVVIGGITFYFQKKTSLLQGEIQLLRDDLTKTQKKLDEAMKIISLYDRILFPEKYGLSERPHHHISSKQYQPPPPNQYHVSTPPKKSAPNPPPQETPVKEEEEEESEIPDEELDALLGEELSNLKEEQQNFIEIECTEDSPDLPGKRKKKVLNPET